jgi:D-alanyl-D-alanine carboxypeptidase/D-alanyl-D-alanine-endopeptidase (penicillin-binding protein 4)
MYPQTGYVKVVNDAVTGVPDSVDHLLITRERGRNTIRIEKTIPQNRTSETESITVENPALFFITVLKETLMDNGIVCSGDLRTDEETDYTACRLIYTHESPPLQDILKVTNKVSHNLYIEQILLTLGAEYGEAGSASEGTKVVSRTMAGIGIPENEFVMQDGSGLSRKDLISPNAAATLLRYMARRDDFDIFFDTLPVAGVDGTLRRLMSGTQAAGRVHAKTGTVGYVRNLSGYVDTIGGERLIFSLLVNHYTLPTSSINLLQDRLCNVLAAFQRDQR